MENGDTRPGDILISKGKKIDIVICNNKKHWFYRISGDCNDIVAGLELDSPISDHWFVYRNGRKIHPK